MSTVLQGALFFASLAIIALAACLIPLALLMVRRIEGLAKSGEAIQASLDLLLRDSRELVQNVTLLSKRAQVQMDDVEVVMQTVRSWTTRADRLVEGIGAVIEPPVFSLVALSSLVRAGAGAFIQSLFHSCQAKTAGLTKTNHEEDDHVGE